MGGVGSKAAVVVATNPRLRDDLILRMPFVTERYNEGDIKAPFNKHEERLR